MVARFAHCSVANSGRALERASLSVFAAGAVSGTVVYTANRVTSIDSAVRVTATRCQTRKKEKPNRALQVVRGGETVNRLATAHSASFSSLIPASPCISSSVRASHPSEVRVAS